MAVSRVGGGVLAEAVKPKYGGIFSAVMQYGGNVLAVGGFSFCGGNTLAVLPKYGGKPPYYRDRPPER